MKSIEEMKLALEAAYLAGFEASGEGYNAEYPFSDKGEPPAENRAWAKDRDNYVNQTLKTFFGIDMTHIKPMKQENLEQDPYASEEETNELIQPDTRTPEQKKHDALVDKNWGNEQGMEKSV